MFLGKPNILLVMTDQQRWDTMSAHVNHFAARTPGMDYLVRHGVTFANAYCTAPICTPSRACLMTGQYPSQVGMHANLSAPCGPLDEGIGTIADRLQAVGYQTVYCGKSHLGGDLGHYGFEKAFENGHDATTLTEACRYWRNRDWAVNKRPFFQIVSFVNPHDVYFLDPDEQCPPELPPWPSKDDDLSTKPWPQRFSRGGGGWTPQRWEYYRRFYRSKVEKVDASIATLLDELVCTGYAPTTWVFFTADHGDMAGEHGLPFKGAYMYEGVTRVPLVVMPPRKRLLGAKNMNPAGATEFTPLVFDGLVSHIDLAPTMLELAGLTVAAGDSTGRAAPELPGRSLLPILEGRSRDGDEAVFAEWHQMGKMVTPIRMVRAGRWKYNLYLHNGEELYDLDADPHELNNLADRCEFGQAKADLRKRLLAHIERTRDPFFSYQPTDRDGKPRCDCPTKA